MTDNGRVRSVSLPIGDWPAIDRQLLEKELTDGDLFDDCGRATRWSAATRRKRIYGYGRWLGFLARSALLDPMLPPAARLTPTTVAEYIADQQHTVSLSSVRNLLEDLIATMVVLQPEAELGWLQKAVRRISHEAVPVRMVQPRLLPVPKLFAAGIAEMQEADIPRPGCRRYRSGAFRDGLAVAFLAACPLRRRSFSALRLDCHLLVIGGNFLVQLGPGDLKNGGCLDFPLPEELSPWLRRYLELHRPMLLDGAVSEHLWINANGQPVSAIGLAERIGMVTLRRLGRAVPMHLFRHAAATGMALHDPHHVQLLAALLGHSTLATSERYYNMATTTEAARNYQHQLALMEFGSSDPGR